jgi:hypothetical protein
MFSILIAGAPTFEAYGNNPGLSETLSGFDILIKSSAGVDHRVYSLLF